ncbi:hypothetical protein Ocin01_05007 [Orchesella cincta]|uniref:Uncharacterized protein n=1 Tax=Orchesella cincta TaxID=48709 RepID=A0A1D2N993_ORCCI|nr:hypothetical protein Ocin01_05007 [Orchesella cincta]
MDDLPDDIGLPSIQPVVPFNWEKRSTVAEQFGLELKPLSLRFSTTPGASIVQGPNGLQPTIKIENTGSYYCNSYTPPGPDHSVLMGSGTYSKSWTTYFQLSISFELTATASSSHAASYIWEHRSKRRRLSSEEDPLDVGGGRDKNNEVTYYGQSRASLSSQASWHSEVDHENM